MTSIPTAQWHSPRYAGTAAQLGFTCRQAGRQSISNTQSSPSQPRSPCSVSSRSAPDRCRQLHGRALALFPQPVFNHVLKGRAAQKQIRTKGRGASPLHAAEGRPCWLLGRAQHRAAILHSGLLAAPTRGCHLLPAAKESAEHGLDRKGPHSPSSAMLWAGRPPARAAQGPSVAMDIPPPPKALGSSATASPPPAHRAGRAGASWEPRAIPHSTAIQPHMPPPTSYCSLHNRAPQTAQQHHSQPQGTTFQPTSGAPPQQPLQHLLSCCTISPCSPHHMGSPSSVAPTNQACCKELPPSPPLPPPNPT